jgi:predicted DNA-binding transcriptional regulator YafY
VEITAEKFDPRARLPLPAPFIGSWGEDRMLEIVIRLGKESRLQVLDHFPRHNVTELPSGGFEIRFSWSENENPVAYLMGFGGGLEVVSPSHLRRALAEIAARLSAANG